MEIFTHCHVHLHLRNIDHGLRCSTEVGQYRVDGEPISGTVEVSLDLDLSLISSWFEFGLYLLAGIWFV